MIMKALTNNDGTKAKPVNPHQHADEFDIVGSWSFKEFEKDYPERFLTTPQQPNVQIEIEDEPVWQAMNVKFDWIETSNVEWSKQNGFSTRQAYKPIEQPKENQFTNPGNMVDLPSVQPIPGQQQKVETAKDLQIAKFEALLRKYGIFEYDVRIFSVLEEMQSNWQQSQSIEPMVDKVLELVEKAAQRGQDFGQATANTVCYDSIEDLIATEFEPQLIKLLKDGKDS